MPDMQVTCAVTRETLINTKIIFMNAITNHTQKLLAAISRIFRKHLDEKWCGNASVRYGFERLEAILPGLITQYRELQIKSDPRESV